MSAEISPAPTEVEAAAILAAVEALWPRPVAPSTVETVSAWRFSSRPWLRDPVSARRSGIRRPWY
ncbi:MAG: hypothetical protein RIR49_471 [Actinomycetota bacterium]